MRGADPAGAASLSGARGSPSRPDGSDVVGDSLQGSTAVVIQSTYHDTLQYIYTSVIKCSCGVCRKLPRGEGDEAANSFWTDAAKALVQKTEGSGDVSSKESTEDEDGARGINWRICFFSALVRP